jgi:hypothetical protein
MLLAIFIETVLAFAVGLSLGPRGIRLVAPRGILLHEAFARPVAVLSFTVLLSAGHLPVGICRHGDTPEVGSSTSR